MKITEKTALLMMDAMAYMFCCCYKTFVADTELPKEPSVEIVEKNVRAVMIQFCKDQNIEEVEMDDDDDDDNYIPDDVDETNYDPYCGCDMFEICGSIDEEW